MKKYDKVRLSLYTYYGTVNGYIEHIPDNYYNRLRYMYFEGLPISFYLLFKDISYMSDAFKTLLFTRIFDKNDEYRLVNADTKVLGNHTFIEYGDDVFDVIINAKINKEYYYKIFKPTNIKISSKDSINDFMDKIMAGEDINDVFNVPVSILDSINRQAKDYTGSKKELIERQVTSYFHDINYDDGLLITDINKIRN